MTVYTARGKRLQVRVGAGLTGIEIRRIVLRREDDVPGLQDFIRASVAPRMCTATESELLSQVEEFQRKCLTRLRLPSGRLARLPKNKRDLHR